MGPGAEENIWGSFAFLKHRLLRKRVAGGQIRSTSGATETLRSQQISFLGLTRQIIYNNIISRIKDVLKFGRLQIYPFSFNEFLFDIWQPRSY